MLSLSDDDVDSDNDNDNGYDGSDILQDLSIGRVYDVHTVKKQLKGAKMSQKVHNVFPYLPPLLGAPSWFQLIKRRFEDSTASNRILFSWWKLL